MKMDSINISLPQPMADFVRGVVKRDYGNASEYFRELVRERIQKQIDADMALLESTMKGAPPGPSEKEIAEVVALQKRLRKERAERKERHARRA
jgi:Arc/MetJ-type ribon-helix-helix transcriptional regulator